MKKFIALLLSVLMLTETFGSFSAFATEENTTQYFNKEGLWLTEIYYDDIDRSIENNQEKQDYEEIKLYPHSEELMEFIEVASTYEGTVNLNENFEIYAGETLLEISDMAGSKDVFLKKGQKIVIWNYRSDLLPEISTESSFETESTFFTETETATDVDETVDFTAFATNTQLTLYETGGTSLTEAVATESTENSTEAESVTETESTENTTETESTEETESFEMTIPTEWEFRKAMRIPSSALILKATNGIDWTKGDFTIKSKETGSEISHFTVDENHSAEGFSVQLKVADMGSEMLVYKEMTIPTAGAIDYQQLNGLGNINVPQTEFAQGLFLTEIRADDVSRSQTYGTEEELMECIEVVNTTDYDIDLKEEYQLMYVEKEGKRKALPLYQYDENSENNTGLDICIIPAKTTAVLWCYRKEYITDFTSFPTLQDFRSQYGIDENIPVFIFTNQNGLDNENKGLEIYDIYSGEKQLVSGYSYSGKGIDLSEGYSANLQVSIDSPYMNLRKANADTTMGKTAQAKYKYVQDDGSALTVTPQTNVSASIMQGDELRVNFNFKGTTALPKTNINGWYRLNGTGQWIKCTNYGIRETGIYEVILKADMLFFCDSIELYIKGENRYRNTYSGVHKISIKKRNEFKGIRTSISKGEEIRGKVFVTANDGGNNENTEIYIDGEKYPVIPAIEDGAYLSFTAQSRDIGYKNAITTTENEIIQPIGVWKNYTLDGQVVRLDNRYFTYDADENLYKVTLRFWSGTLGTTAEDYLVPSGNRDNYTITNLALNLVNGNVYYPVSVTSKSGESFNTGFEEVYKLGNSAGMSLYIDVSFSLPASEVTAVGTELDTTAMTQGEHILKATNGEITRQVNFIVDNTAPKINCKIKNNSTLTGNIKISPPVSEANTLAEKIVFLDGKQIELPYKTTAYAMGKGSHNLEIHVRDMAGNTSEKLINFNVSYADIGVKSAKTTSITDTTAKITLTLNQPDENGKADFYRGKKISQKKITATKVEGILPYLKYTVNVGEIQNTDQVIVNWSGSASNTDGYHLNRMYVLNTKTNQWEHIATADEKGIIDKAVFVGENHIKDGSATVLVQCTDESKMADTDTTTDGQKDVNANWDGASFPVDYDFAFAWETDTQYYAKSYPSQYKAMNRWIANNSGERKISYVIHTGDIVNEPDLVYQWDVADKAMKILENNHIPYGVLAGNHDVGSGLEINDNYFKYFGQHRFENKSYYGGSYKNNLGHYDLISQNGQDFIIVYMSWNIYQEEIDWINSVLEKYSNRKAILCLHTYTKSVNGNGTLLDYFGQMLYKEVVAKNPNLFAVLNGHSHGASYATAKFDDDGDGIKERTVYQICTDYQNGEKGGNQYFKLLYFDLDSNKIYINSYSPLLNDFNYFDGEVQNMNVEGAIVTRADCGVMEVNFNTENHSISANEFSAYVSSNEKLGSATADEKGKVVAKLTGLKQNTTYLWYSKFVATDSGQLTTEFYSFTTLKSAKLSASSKTMKAGENYNLTVENTYENPVSYSVSESDKQYIRVNSQGKITALKKTDKGATVNVKVGKKLLKCKITVKNSPELVDAKGYKQRNIVIRKGKKKKIFITGKAPNLNNVYKSSKGAVITGKTSATAFTIKGKKKGTSIVTIKVNRTCVFKLPVTVK